MPLIKQGGTNPYTGQTLTTTGYKNHRPPVCTKCRERKEDELYTFDANGQLVCASCSGNYGRGVLRPDEDSSFDVAPADTDS